MSALDGLVGGIRTLYEGGVELTFRRALDFTDMAATVLSDRVRWVVSGLQGTPVDDTAPTTGQVLTFDGTSWAPADAGDVARTQWVALVAGTDYTAAPSGMLTLTTATDLRATVRPGDPVRWMSSACALTNNTIAS